MNYSDTSSLRLMAEASRLALAPLPKEEAARHTQALLRFRSGLGFRGRRGQADLYYTAFAARTLYALNRLDAGLAAELTCFHAQVVPATLIDLANALELGMLLGLDGERAAGPLAQAERFRAPDGGYGKTLGARTGSTYHSFMAALAYNLLGELPPGSGRLGQFVLSRQCADGGFCEEAAAHGGSNPTAAGLGLMQILDLRKPAQQQAAAGFLLNMREAGGGWRAVRQAPVGDLLSTYTAVAALAGVNALKPDVLEAALNFARTCERAEGGYGAGPWDATADPEYTFYGLGVQALARLHGSVSF